MPPPPEALERVNILKSVCLTHTYGLKKDKACSTCSYYETLLARDWSEDRLNKIQASLREHFRKEWSPSQLEAAGLGERPKKPTETEKKRPRSQQEERPGTSGMQTTRPSSQQSITKSKDSHEIRSRTSSQESRQSSASASARKDTRTKSQETPVPTPSVVATATEPRPELPMEVAEESQKPEEVTFVKPTKTVPMAKLLTRMPKAKEVPLKNQFQSIQPDPEGEEDDDLAKSTDLSDESDTEDERTPEQVRKKARNIAPKPSMRKPPPLVIQGQARQDTRRFTEAVKERVTGKFELKHTKNTTIVYTQRPVDYELLKRHLIKEHDENNLEFHTYTSPDQKTHAFVMRGFDGDYTEEEIKTALEEEHDMTIKAVYKMKKTFRPLYLVITNDQWTLRKLNTIVRAILHARVTWEHRKATRPFSQCSKCLQWGHSKVNCFRTQHCVHCSMQHSVAECSRIEEPPICHNCKGPHRASSIECPVYSQRLEQKTKEKEQAKPRYIPAPLPTTNKWLNRPETTRRVEDFPPLGNTVERQRQQPDTAPIHTQTITNLKELTNQCERLNKLINLDGAIQAIKRLADLLTEHDNEPATKLTILQNFVIHELPTYNI